MSLLEDEIKPTPRNYLLGLLADAAQKANETVSRPGGYDNPPARMLMSLLGVPAIAQTLDRLSYGEPLTTGRGMTTKMRPEVTEALLSVAPGVGPAAKATGKAAKSVAPKAAQMAEQYMFEQGLAKPIIVWHGSPHKFEKFDASKIGTGEGAQAYGHGLYVAESPDVAGSYKAMTGYRPDIVYRDLVAAGVSPDAANSYAQYAAQTRGANAAFDDFAAIFNQTHPHASNEAFRASIRKELPKIKETLNDLKGNLYKIDLPDEQIARMLDWDKLLSQQAPEVQKALSEGWLAHPLSDAKKTGSDIYSNLMRAEYGPASTPEGVAEALKRAGIPGIRYLDQGSRSAGQGTSNFVIFPGEESILKILERNGIPIESLL